MCGDNLLRQGVPYGNYTHGEIFFYGYLICTKELIIWASDRVWLDLLKMQKNHQNGEHNIRAQYCNTLLDQTADDDVQDFANLNLLIFQRKWVSQIQVTFL